MRASSFPYSAACHGKLELLLGTQFPLNEKKGGSVLKPSKKKKSECGNFQLTGWWQEALSSVWDVFGIQGHLI